MIIKAYNQEGVFISKGTTNKEGLINLECPQMPSNIKYIMNNSVVNTQNISNLKAENGVISIIVPPFCIHSPKWHITGMVKDKRSEEPLQGLTIEVWDKDIVGKSTYEELLGESITNQAGRFDVWFNDTDFQRDDTYSNPLILPKPDVFIKVKNNKGVLIHETEVDNNVSGKCTICSIPLCPHQGKHYLLEIDYVTVNLTQIGPVAVADIDSSTGLATYNHIDNRPFGGITTLSGRIWGAEVKQWKLFYAKGFIDSNDNRFNNLKPNSTNPNGFITLKEGTNRIWDGPITNWDTNDLEGIYTVILVVWDTKNNEYHDTQILVIDGVPIAPPAQISSPLTGSTLSKSNNNIIDIQGTANGKHFLKYWLLWVGSTYTELSRTEDYQIDYPNDNNETAVINGVLGTWDIGNLPNGPYCLRLDVRSRTIYNNDASSKHDWTWQMVNIVS